MFGDDNTRTSGDQRYGGGRVERRPRKSARAARVDCAIGCLGGPHGRAHDAHACHNVVHRFASRP